MVKRYYCDYCDRSFKDDAEARKKHLSSLQHAKNRADHYSFYKDPETILMEESAKIPCKRFLSHGDCAFGNNCKFSHYTAEAIWEIQRMVNYKKEVSESLRNWPNSTDVIKEYFQDAVDHESIVESENHNFWKYPMEFQNYTNSTPSLWPLTAKSMNHSNFGKWGL